MKKAFQITLIVGLAILGLSVLLPTISISGTSIGIYGAIIANDWIGGAVIYILALPFVALLSLNNNKKLTIIGYCLGIGMAVLNLYTFALAVDAVKTSGGPAVINAGPIFGLIGAIAVLGIILANIVFDMFGVKTTEPVQPTDILVWKDLLDKEIITKEEFEQKKNEILKLNVKNKTQTNEVPPEDK